MYLVLYPTGMAQRKRARLIISRTLVRPQLPAFSICRFSETDGHSSSDPKQEPHNRGSAGAARGAHNLEVVRSKRTPGIYHSGGFIRTRHRCLHSTTHRLSSSEERTAHNREVAGSTLAGGIYHYAGLSESASLS